MTPELTVLGLAALLQAVQLTLAAVPANLEVGFGKTLSPRDRERLGGNLIDIVSTRTARLYRAFNNHIEGLVFFTIAVVLVTFAEASSPITQTAAWTYFAARILYVPAYVFGWVPWRSLLWLTGFLATFVMILAALVA